jgi:hypothetical protein
MPSLLDRLQARIELFRLEQRYTRRRNRRSTFVSNATYVDGEYIYNTPNTTGSSGQTASSSSSSYARTNVDARANAAANGSSPSAAAVRMGEREMAAQAQRQAEVEARAQQAIEEEERRQMEKRAARKLNRWSSMPGFGSVGRSAGMSGGGMSRVDEQDFWRPRRNSAEGGR